MERNTGTCSGTAPYLFGRHYADHSLSYEKLADQPQATLEELLRAVRIPDADVGSLHSLIDSPKAEKWKRYADEAWFQRHEAACEGVIAGFFGRGQEETGPVRSSGPTACRPHPLRAPRPEAAAFVTPAAHGA
jgi:hypothetical protein